MYRNIKKLINYCQLFFLHLIVINQFLTLTTLSTAAIASCIKNIKQYNAEICNIL